MKNLILLEELRKKNHRLLAESVSGLTADQRRIVEGIYREFTPLIEASLSADQVQQLFGSIEKAVTDGGDNRTLLGLGKDAASEVKKTIDNVGKWLQDTVPVKFADQKFEDLKKKISEKFPDLEKQLTNFGTWMKENPGKSAAVIGILTTLAALSGGPVGGAIAGQILRGTASLIKGEKLSTAVGQGVKTAALGFITGKAFEMIGDWLGNLRASMIPFGDEDAGITQMAFSASRQIKTGGMEWTRKINPENIKFVMFKDDADTINRLIQDINQGDSSAFDKLYSLAKEIGSNEYLKQMNMAYKGAFDAAKNNDMLYKIITNGAKAAEAASQGAVAAATSYEKKPKESFYRQTRPLSEGQVYLVFNKLQNIDEGIWDNIKKGLGKGAEFVSKKAHNLTTKITSDKLNSAWVKAGSPTDSDELKTFLTQQGIDNQIINTVYSDMKISTDQEVKSVEKTDKIQYKEIASQVEKLSSRDKNRLTSYLKKQLGTA